MHKVLTDVLQSRCCLAANDIETVNQKSSWKNSQIRDSFLCNGSFENWCKYLCILNHKCTRVQGASFFFLCFGIR